MTVLSEIKSQLVHRVKGQRLGDGSAGERSTLSSTLQSLMKAHLGEFGCGDYLTRNKDEIVTHT